MNGAEVVMAGELRHKVWIYQKAIQADEVGGKTEVWQKVTVNPTWMALQTPSAFETNIAAQNSLQLTHIITMRYKSYVTADMAIYWPLENRVFSITGIRRVDAKRRKMQVNAMERRDLDTGGW